MKNIIVLLVCLCASISAYAGEVRVFINWGDGSPYDYIMNDVASCPPGRCGDCIILVLGGKSAKVTVNQLGGYDVEVPIGELQYQRKNWPYETQGRSAAGFKFCSSATARIEASDEYQGLVGVTTSLNGKLVDDDGILRYHIP